MRKQAEEFHRWLRDTKTPHVDTDEAQNVLDGPKRLDTFDCVVYTGGGGSAPNLLAHVATKPTPAMAETMKSWQDIFGVGFIAVFVKMHRGAPYFTDLDGRPYHFAGVKPMSDIGRRIFIMPIDKPEPFTPKSDTTPAVQGRLF